MYLVSNPLSLPGSSSAMSSALQQSATLLNTSQSSAANTALAITLTGAAGQRISVRYISIKATGAAVSSSFTISDGGTVVLDFGVLSIPLLGASTNFFGVPLMTGSTGNNVVINVGAGGALAVTTVSVIADRQ